MTPGRAIGYLCLVCGLAAFGAAGLRLTDATTFQPDAHRNSALVPVAGTDTELGKGTSDASQALAARPFLPIFGVTAPPAEAIATTVAAPEPLRIDYDLKGVIASDTMRWAIFAGSDGDLLVREGELIGDTARVAKIHAEGVDVMLGDNTISMTFSENAPVEVGAFAASREAKAPDESTASLPRPEPQKVIYQNMSRAEVLAVLREAEEKRQARGWVTATQ